MGVAAIGFSPKPGEIYGPRVWGWLQKRIRRGREIAECFREQNGAIGYLTSSLVQRYVRKPLVAAAHSCSIWGSIDLDYIYVCAGSCNAVSVVWS